MEQTLAFCQVVLRQDLVDKVRKIGETGVNTIELRPELVTKIKKHITETPKDPLPFPSFDPDPQVSSSYFWFGISCENNSNTVHTGMVSRA